MYLGTKYTRTCTRTYVRTMVLVLASTRTCTRRARITAQILLGSIPSSSCILHDFDSSTAAADDQAARMSISVSDDDDPAGVAGVERRAGGST
jgi:hypothetical protein